MPLAHVPVPVLKIRSTETSTAAAMRPALMYIAPRWIWAPALCGPVGFAGVVVDMGTPLPPSVVPMVTHGSPSVPEGQEDLPNGATGQQVRAADGRSGRAERSQAATWSSSAVPVPKDPFAGSTAIATAITWDPRDSRPNCRTR